MATKQNKYTNVELDWAERKLKEWMTFVDANPFHKMEDRITLKETKNGGFIPVTAATIEQQQKNIRDTIKDYLMLLEVVENLRTKEEMKANNSTYGNVKESIRMINSTEQKDE